MAAVNPTTTDPSFSSNGAVTDANINVTSNDNSNGNTNSTSAFKALSGSYADRIRAAAAALAASSPSHLPQGISIPAGVVATANAATGFVSASSSSVSTASPGGSQSGSKKRRGERESKQVSVGNSGVNGVRSGTDKERRHVGVGANANAGAETKTSSGAGASTATVTNTNTNTNTDTNDISVDSGVLTNGGEEAQDGWKEVTAKARQRLEKAAKQVRQQQQQQGSVGSGESSSAAILSGRPLKKGDGSRSSKKQSAVPIGPNSSSAPASSSSSSVNQAHGESASVPTETAENGSAVPTNFRNGQTVASSLPAAEKGSTNNASSTPSWRKSAAPLPQVENGIPRASPRSDAPSSTANTQTGATKPVSETTNKPVVNVWKIRKEQMATPKAVAPSSSSSVFSAMASSSVAKHASERRTNEQVGRTKNMDVVGKSTGSGKNGKTTAQKATKGLASSMPPPVANGEAWPDVQASVRHLLSGEQAKKKVSVLDDAASVQSGSQASGPTKKEKMKWTPIPREEMQEALDKAERDRRTQSEGPKPRTRAKAGGERAVANNKQGQQGKGSNSSANPQGRSSRAASVATNSPKKTKQQLREPETTPLISRVSSREVPTASNIPAAPTESETTMIDNEGVESKADAPITKEEQKNPSTYPQDSNSDVKEQSVESQTNTKERESVVPSKRPGQGPAGLDRQKASAAGLLPRGGASQQNDRTAGNVGTHTNGVAFGTRGGAKPVRGARGGRGGARGGSARYSGDYSPPTYHPSLSVSPGRTQHVPLPNAGFEGTQRSGFNVNATPYAAGYPYTYYPQQAVPYSGYGYTSPPEFYDHQTGYVFGAQAPPPLPVTQAYGMDPSRVYILGQLEYYFSVQNLAMDFFLRQQMDHNGWVDIATIASFNRIKNHTTDVALVKECAQLSGILEVREDKLRLSNGQYRQWVLPGAPSSPLEEDGNVAFPPQIVSELNLGHPGDLSDEARGRIQGDVQRDVLRSSSAKQQQSALEFASIISSTGSIDDDKAHSVQSDLNDATSKVDEVHL